MDRTLRNAARNTRKIVNHKNLMINVGDLVVCWLNPPEVAKLLSRFGSAKFAPRWSEPCRVLKFLNADTTTMLVKSIWHKGIVKKVHASGVHRLPTRITPEALNAAKFELVADLKRNEVP